MVFIQLMYTSRKAAQKAGSRVYNDKKPCPRNHLPAIRLTASGRCIECLRMENEEISIQKEQEFREALKTYTEQPILACYFWFTFPNGDVQRMGPYKSRRGAARALSVLWFNTHGYPHPIVDPSDFN